MLARHLDEERPVGPELLRDSHLHGAAGALDHDLGSGLHILRASNREHHRRGGLHRLDRWCLLIVLRRHLESRPLISNLVDSPTIWFLFLFLLLLAHHTQ